LGLFLWLGSRFFCDRSRNWHLSQARSDGAQPFPDSHYRFNVLALQKWRVYL